MTAIDDDFEDIANGITNSSAWYAAVQEARAELHREQPAGVDVAAIGHRAWRQLTPVQQAHALDGLFVAYICRLYDEERAEKLDQASAEAKTYVQPDDEYHLHECLNLVRPIGEDTRVDGVYAECLSNVLDELVLLRHRLAMANAEGGE